MLLLRLCCSCKDDGSEGVLAMRGNGSANIGYRAGLALSLLLGAMSASLVAPPEAAAFVSTKRATRSRNQTRMGAATRP